MLHEIDLSRTDLNLLVLFEAVMETHHVGRAATRLNLSPSAVSHGLGRLRTLLGDPLFLRTPRGVVPTERAENLAPHIADILVRIRSVVASIAPFDPARSTRRFCVGAPDAVSAVLLPPLLRHLSQVAPRVDLSVRQLLPRRGATGLADAWSGALIDLEARLCDVAVLPLHEVPKRFSVSALYHEDFVVAARIGHSFLKSPSLDRFLEARHVLVSETGEAVGMVDAALEQRGLSRRISVTAPSFALAMALLADNDLLCTLPRRLVAQNGSRLGVEAAEVPLELPRYTLSAVVPSGAVADAGVAWLVATLEVIAAPESSRTKAPRPRLDLTARR
jgi:DNA-binding transcriptional LysR family regulator